jgi:hypothetical protein
MLAGGTLAVLLVLIGRQPLADVRAWARLVTGRVTADQYYARFRLSGQTDFAEQRAVAHYLRTHSRPGEPFALWSADASIPFLADRPNVSRFYNKRVFTHLAGPIVEGYRREYLESIRTLRPSYVVVGRRVDAPELMPSRAVLERDMPELAALVEQRYALEAQVGPFDVYRLRGTLPPAPGSPTPR